MGLGGVLYTIGVVFLLNDRRMPYMHAVWHLFVILAAGRAFRGDRVVCRGIGCAAIADSLAATRSIASRLLHPRSGGSDAL